MRDTIDMAHEAGLFTHKEVQPEIKAFEALVRADAIADEREKGQRWFDAVMAQHRAEILAEREACAEAAENFLTSCRSPLGRSVAAAIRARGEASKRGETK
jgi:hypothetical protein